jgi:hypothetical protein
MTLSGTPVADPFFAATRRGPGLDTPPDPGPVDDEVVAAVVARVGFFTAELCASVAPTDELGELDDFEPDLTLAPGEDEAEVRVEVRVSDTAALPADSLVMLRAELEHRGWEVDPAATSAPAALAAHLDGGTVTASYAGSGLALTVDSAPLPVGLDRARTYLRDGVLA